MGVDTAERESPRTPFYPGTALFVLGAILLFIATRVGIPVLTIGLNLDPLLAWFIAAGIIVFLPLLGLAAVLLRLEGGRLGPDLWVNRLRFRSLSGSDLRLAFLGVVIVALVTGGLSFLLVTLSGPQALRPSFLPIEPLERDRYWLLAAWLPFFVLNIMGEEILWRGVLLPRQEAAHGRAAWVVNGPAFVAISVGALG